MTAIIIIGAIYVIGWLWFLYELKNAPTDVELWGKEIE